MEDVELMCEKRRSSLKKVVANLSRPVNVVSPEPVKPPHYRHYDRSGKPLLRNGSEGSLLKSNGSANVSGDSLSLGGSLVCGYFTNSISFYVNEVL